MSQLTINVSAKAEAMIATLQKEIFNRRRKKVTAQGVVETLVESGAKSQSDKRYAASWKLLIQEIEKAAKQPEIHGNKPANVTAEEWALIVAHRTRKASTANAAPKKRATKKSPSQKAAPKKATTNKPVAKKSVTKKASAKKTSISTSTKPTKARRAKRAPAKPVVKLA